MSPKLQARVRCASSAPIAWAASSITLRPWRRASAMQRLIMSATWPYRCTGIRALARAAGAAIHQLSAATLAVLVDEGLDGLGREVEGHRIDVAEQRPRAGAGDGAGGGKEGEGAGDDLIARPDLQGHQGQQQRIGARGDADAVLALAVGRHARLELRTSGPG